MTEKETSGGKSAVSALCGAQEENRHSVWLMCAPESGGAAHAEAQHHRYVLGIGKLKVHFFNQGALEYG